LRGGGRGLIKGGPGKEIKNQKEKRKNGEGMDDKSGRGRRKRRKNAAK